MGNKCSCGHSIDHEKVIHKSDYSKFGWFLFTILGLSAQPKKVSFICSDCNEIISESNEPELLKKFIGR